MKFENLVNVCASASSGTTMLAQILNRHPDIACGDEMFLFCTPLLFEDYEKFKRHARWLRLTGVPGHPFHRGRTLLKIKGYDISKKTMWQWVRQSRDFSDYCSRIQSHIREKTGKSFWAEKTPRNARVIGQFLNYFQNAKAVHLVRDPRDVIASLSGRNKNMLQAAEVWLTSVASAYTNEKNSRLITIRYEDLCRDTEETLKKVCSHIGVAYSDGFYMLDKHRSNFGSHTHHDSWRQMADAPVSASSIGRHREFSADWNSIGQIRLTTSFAQKLGCKKFSIAELADVFGYDFKLERDSSTPVYGLYDDYRKTDSVRQWLDQRLGIEPYQPAVEYPEGSNFLR